MVQAIRRIQQHKGHKFNPHDVVKLVHSSNGVLGNVVQLESQFRPPETLNGTDSATISRSRLIHTLLQGSVHDFQQGNALLVQSSFFAEVEASLKKMWEFLKCTFRALWVKGVKFYSTVSTFEDVTSEGACLFAFEWVN